MTFLENIFSYKLLLPVGIILVVLYSIQKNSNFIRIRGIFSQYMGIFNGSFVQICFFFGVPILFAISFAQLSEPDQSTFDTMYVVVSILITMFFSVLTILTGENRQKSEEYKQVLNETINCILFEIVVSIFILAYGFIFQMLLNLIPTSFVDIFASIFYYMIFFLLLNLFIIVKRFKILNDVK